MLGPSSDLVSVSVETQNIEDFSLFLRNREIPTRYNPAPAQRYCTTLHVDTVLAVPF